MKRLNLAAAVSLAAGMAALCLPSRGAAYVIQQAGSGDTIRWHESCFQYSIHEDGVPGIDIAGLRDTIRASFDAWENVDCTYFYFEETEDASCDHIGYVEDTGNINLLVFRESGWAVDRDHDPSAIALTTTSWDDLSGRLLDADIEFNAENFPFGIDGSADKADIQNTATHEIGHMLGLDHSNVAGSTMSPTAGTGETTKSTLADDDIEGLCTLYPLDDDPNVCKAPHCGLDLSCSASDCDKSGIAYPTTTIEDGCTTAVHLGSSAPFHWFSVLLSLLSLK